jgi:hypothetical protein
MDKTALLLAQQGRHLLHGLMNIPEEGLISFTKHIQAVRPFHRSAYPILGAAALTGK